MRNKYDEIRSRLHFIDTFQADNMDFPLREPPKSHVVTLNNGLNNAASFVSYLPQKLTLPRGYYEVGCLKLKCYKTEDSVPSDEVIEENGSKEISVSTSDLFPALEEPAINHVDFFYETQTILITFTSLFNFAMKDRVSVRYYDDEQYCFDLDVRSSGVSIVLQPELARLFGMHRTSRMESLHPNFLLQRV